MVGNVAHVDEGVRCARAMRPWLTGGAELGRVSRIDRFSLGPIEEGSKRGRDGSRGARVLARGTRSCT